MTNTAVVLVVADLHFGSTLGLCTPFVELDDGGKYEASHVQQAYLWESWKNLAKRFKKAKNEARGVLIVDGDLVDRNVHSKHQLFTVNQSVLVSGCVKVLRPMLDVAETVIIVRGTEAHVGGSGELEEIIAKEIGAEQDPKTGLFSWWYAFLDIEGVTFDVTHHPGTFARRPWTLDAAAARQSAIIRMENLEMSLPVPDLAFRAHYHTRLAMSAQRPSPQAFFLSPWQITTAYGYRRGARMGAVPVGGVLVTCRKAKYTLDLIEYTPTGRGKPCRV